MYVTCCMVCRKALDLLVEPVAVLIRAAETANVRMWEAVADVFKTQGLLKEVLYEAENTANTINALTIYL